MLHCTGLDCRAGIANERCQLAAAKEEYWRWIGERGGGAVREETDATRTEETDRTADRSPPRRTRSHYGDRFIKRKRKEENDASVADRTQLPSTVVRRKSNRNQSKPAIRRRTDQTPQQLGLYRRRDDARRHSQSHIALSRTHRRVGVSIDK